MSSFSRINTNIQSLQALQNLQDTSGELAERRERLTTGKRINSAKDDSAGFAIAKKLEARTRGQSQALKNIGDAQSALNVAEGALDSQLDILQTQKEKTVQAANDSLGTSERIDIQEQLFELNEEANDIAENAEFNGKKLLNGGGRNSDSQDLTFQVGAQKGDDFEVSIDSSKAEDIGIQSDSRNGIVFTKGISESGGTLSNASVTSGSPTDFDIEFSTTGGTQDTAASGTETLKLDLSIETADGSKTTGSVTFTGSSTGGTEASNDTTLEGDQIIELTNGSGDLNSSFTADTAAATTGIAIKFSEAQANELLEEQVSNDGGEGSFRAFSRKSELDVSSSANAQSAVQTVDDAINNVVDQQAALGDAQTRLDFKEGNLETTQTNLEEARSQIEDADFAREQTEVAKLQILQQTGTAQLAQANASSQSVLSLIG